MACRHSRLDCVKVLLEGRGTQVPDRCLGRTPKQEAAATGNSDVLSMIVRHEEVQAELAAQAAAAAGHGEAAPGRAAGSDS